MKKPRHVKCEVHNIEIPYYSSGCPKCRDEAKKYRWNKTRDHETEQVTYYVNLLDKIFETIKPKHAKGCPCTECKVRAELLSTSNAVKEGYSI